MRMVLKTRRKDNNDSFSLGSLFAFPNIGFHSKFRLRIDFERKQSPLVLIMSMIGWTLLIPFLARSRLERFGNLSKSVARSTPRRLHRLRTILFILYLQRKSSERRAFRTEARFCLGNRKSSSSKTGRCDDIHSMNCDAHPIWQLIIESFFK